jgi:hypothetical protein
MKVSIIFATGLMLATGVVAGSINVAQAGEGGAAGSISAQFTATGNNLTATAGAVAVGKSGAFTTARTTAADISAVAVGNGGVLAVNGINAAIVDYAVTQEAGGVLGTLQGNTFTSAPTLNLLPGNTTGVTIP